MTLNNRCVIYSCTKRKVNYLNPRETTTTICLFAYSNDLRENIFIVIPDICKTPRDIEMFAEGLKFANLEVERTDYNL